MSAKISCEAEQAGSTFSATIGDTELDGAGFQGPTARTTFTDVDLGTVTIDRAGVEILKVQPTSKAKDVVMNLRSVTLAPVK